MEGMRRGRAFNTSVTTIWVMRLQLAFYIVATPGSSTSNGKITYIVMGNLILDYAKHEDIVNLNGCLRKLKWPMRFKIKHYNKNRNLV